MPTAGRYQYASNSVMKTILQVKYPVLELEDPLFQICPIVSVAADKVIWQQRDSFTGLLTARGINAPYGVVHREGVDWFEVRPGYYGDKKIMDEQFLTQTAQMGTWGDRIDLNEGQASDQEHLLTRALQRIKYTLWNFFVTGKYTSTDALGNIIVQDNAGLTPFQTSVAWNLHSTATPLYDIRQMKLRHRYQSVSFGKDARLFLNSQDVNDLLANSNPNDLGGFRSIILGSASAQSIGMTLEAVNSFLLRNDLPQIVEWDDSWITDAGVGTLYIPYQSGVLVGQRLRGEPVAEFIMTLNPELMYGGQGAKQPRMTGGEAMANLYYNFSFEHEPIKAISAMGFNGAPAIYYPGSVVPVNTSGGGSDN